MNLWFLYTESQVTQALASPEAAGAGWRLVPVLPRPALALARTGRGETRMPVQFLSPEEGKRVREEAVTLSHRWAEPLRQRLRYQGVDLLECCRVQMMEFCQDLVAARRAVPRMLEELQPRRVRLPRLPATPPYDTTPFHSPYHLFSAVVRQETARRGIAVEDWPPPGGEPEPGASSSPPMPTGASVGARLRGALGRLWRRLRNTPPAKPEPPPPPPRDPRQVSWKELAAEGRPVVVGYGNDWDLLQTWPLVRELARSCGAAGVMMADQARIPEGSLRSGLYDDPELRFLLLGEVPPADDEGPELAQLEREALEALAGGGEALVPELRCPGLEYQMELVFRRWLPKAVDTCRRAHRLFSSLPVVAYVDNYSAGVANRALTAVAAGQGITTVTFPHGGGMARIEMYDFNAHYTLAWGELNRRRLAAAFPQREGRVLVAGCPVMEELQRRAQPPRPDTRGVALITGGVLQQVWTDFDPQRFLSFWQEVVREAARRPHLEFIIKPHPSVRDFPDYYKELVATSGLSNLRVVDDRRLEEVLPRCFLSVLVGKPGTAGLVSLLCRVPVVYFDRLLGREVPGYRIWREEHGMPCCHTPGELWQTIDELWTRPERRREVWKQNQRLRKLLLAPFQPQVLVKQLDLTSPR